MHPGLVRHCVKPLRPSSSVRRIIKRSIRSSGAAGSQGRTSSCTLAFAELAGSKNPLGLESLPIPALKDTVERYLQSLEPLVGGKDTPAYREVEAVCASFLQRDGPVLQARLQAQDAQDRNDPHSYPYSYVQRFWDDMYLEGRWPLPINSNPYLAIKGADDAHHPGSSSGTSGDAQLTAASGFVHAWLQWTAEVREGRLALPSGPKTASCVSFIASQLGTSRIPRRGRDELVHSPHSEHVIVICNNRFFRLNVVLKQEGVGPEGGREYLSRASLRRAMEVVRNMALQEEAPRRSNGNSMSRSSSSQASSSSAFVGYLTGIDRDEWAAAREELEGHSAVNRASLADVASALLVIGLDGDSNSSSSSSSSSKTMLGSSESRRLAEAGKTFLHGGSDCPGRNRFFDAHQVLVLPNGNVAINTEHSYSDGLTWTGVLDYCWRRMQSGQEGKEGQAEQQQRQKLEGMIHPLQWDISRDMAAKIDGAKQAQKSAADNLCLDMLRFEDFGKGAMKKWKMSPDAVCQLAFHTAYLRLHGRMAPTYESCATSRFRHGRTEVIRTCSTEMADAVLELGKAGSSSTDTKAAALLRAANKHVQLALLAQQGQGVDRHLAMLRVTAAQAAQQKEEQEQGEGEGEGPRLGDAFFSHPLFGQSSTWLMSTSNLSVPCLEQFGFGPVTGDGYGLGYVVHDETVTAPVTSFASGRATDGPALVRGIEDALREMQRIFEAARQE